MRNLGVVRDGALAIHEGKIVAVSKTRDVTKAFRGNYVLSAKGKTVLPGFVDPHTHLVFAGSLEDELEMYVEGTSFMEILNNGNAILKRQEKRAGHELINWWSVGWKDLILCSYTGRRRWKSKAVMA